MIFNKTYDFETTGYEDLPSVDEDEIKVQETLEFLGINKENIFKFKNAKNGEMTTLKCKMIGIFQKA